MGYLINMPKLEMGMQQGTLLEWHVDEGDPVEEGQVVAEIESEKTIAEIEAQEDGVLRRILVKEGTTVEPGTALGIVAEEDEDISGLEPETGVETGQDSEQRGKDSSEKSDTTDPQRATKPAEATETPGSEINEKAESNDLTNRPETIKASPKARKSAMEHDVELDHLQGTGPNGAIVIEDVERAIEATSEATTQARERAEELGVALSEAKGTGPRGVVTTADVEAAAGGVGFQRELTGMRRAIADRLSQSYRDAVHVTVHREVDVEELAEATEVADSYYDVDVSMTDLLLLAVSATLEEHPAFNATFEDGIHTSYTEQHVGVAVDIDRGLVTPVVKNVESQSLSDLVSERRALTQRVLNDEHSMEDLAGGTFTISNLGVLGIDSFTPIIDPPQVAILGVDSIDEVPVRDGDDVAFRRHMGLDLSFDHRVVDGADAARFLRTLTEQIRDPWPLLLDRA